MATMAGEAILVMSDEGSPYPVRADLAAAQARAWDRLARPGTWLDGATRVRVAAETRHAPGCALCARRKAALSPYAIDGAHDGRGELSDSWIEAIHRIVADPGRLTHAWYRRMLASGIADTEYVEIVSVIAHVTAIDTFARGLGIPLRPPPTPLPGAPSRYRPAEARQNEAWAPNIAWEEHGPNEADYFAGPPANIRRALSLVPDEARSFFDLVGHQYLPGPAMRDFGREYRAITHPQIELIAGRISAINRCVY
jgi:alkylhydroperoxidase family enzyme